ncbi:11921_t:CDS:2 [Acaulospora colombiana]|uniref:11921_t:CDS:1 n=1 Tax=Acaulospora colombiana TaxID=27376 RepID=A0ACA9PV77_9GLOM|nr:11921_t:CDS:2 [Acaulospora colombiana]
MDSLTIRPVLAFHQDQDPHRSSIFPSVGPSLTNNNSTSSTPSISLVQTVPDMPVEGCAASTGGGHYQHAHHTHHTSTTANHLHPGHLDGGASLFHPAHNAYRSGAWDRQAQAPAHSSSLQQPVSVAQAIPPIGCTSLACMSATAANSNSAVANNHVANACWPSAAVDV